MSADCRVIDKVWQEGAAYHATDKSDNAAVCRDRHALRVRAAAATDGVKGYERVFTSYLQPMYLLELDH